MLEIIDYDLEGAAYRDGDGQGPIVDGAFLLAKVRRKPVIKGGVIVADLGDVTTLRLPVSGLDAAAKARLFAAFGEIEACVKLLSEAGYTSASADAKALDAKIAQAAQAAKDVADKRAELAAMQASLDAITAQHAEKLAAIAAIPSP